MPHLSNESRYARLRHIGCVAKYAKVNNLQLIIFYWRFNYIDCFNSNWRQKWPSLRKNFLCRPEIGRQFLTDLSPKPGPTWKARPDFQLLGRLYHRQNNRKMLVHRERRGALKFWSEQCLRSSTKLDI